MLRISSRIKPHVASKIARGHGARRLQSTHSGGGGSGGKVLIAAAGATSLVAGVVGYAAWSNDNRKSIENTIPGSGYVLGALLGPVMEPLSPKPVTKDVGLMKKKLDREKKKKKEEEVAPAVTEGEGAKSEAPAVREDSTEPVKADEVVLEQVSRETEPESIVELEPTAPQISSEAEVAGISSDIAGAEAPGKDLIITTPGKPEAAPEPSKEMPASDLETRLASGEIEQDVENATLTQVLEDLASTAQKNLTAALASAEDAAVVIRQHAEKAYLAIDAGQDKEVLFAAVAELSEKKAEVVKAAQEKISQAEEAVEKLKEQIAQGLSSSLTHDNKSLITAEESLAELKYAVENIKTVISQSERDSKVVSDYRNLVETGREQFEAEVRSLLPEVKLGETSDKLTRDELNLLIAHAHRKVLQLQNQLARLQTLEHDRFKEALNKQRDDDAGLLEAKINASLEKQKQHLDVEFKRKVAQLREELEGELRAQLKRQAAAHSDHLADVLSVQEKELESKWSELLQDKVQSEKDKYLSSVAVMQGQLDGLKSAMTARADVDKAAYSARELWLACESLRSALRLGKEGARSWEEQLKPLDEHISAIKAAGGENPYLNAVLGAVSGEARARGVYTEDALRERFIKVDRICKRVSMIGDNGGSLIKYMLSYVQSFLILNAFEYLPGNEVRDEEVPVDSLSVYDILARARYCLDKDDLLQSVRYMNLLRGEARNVASSWIEEARLTLETRQAADALLAHAAATAVKAL
ncbi:MICOS complex subunit MIC60-like isoform X2 [Penaeus japonicus]|uniref:MICOS complex subunit MIC60-like isoform X2 n=1 Tax=Penaeus japonicus TaxID=27405 RepID=UPI001C70D9BD|nr:MICOS complex subunit MIC60-like isoform X2 [Penaeus japonicus]